MRQNRFYEAMMEGRYQIPIDVNMTADGEAYCARYTDIHGVTIEVTDQSRAEAHRRCTDQVRDGVREGTIVPGL